MTEASERKDRHRPRRIAAGVLVVVFSIGIVLSTVAVWSSRTALKTDRFVDAVAPLPNDPAVQRALSVFLVDELLGVIDAKDRVEQALSQLDERAEFLSGPLIGAVRDYLEQAVVTVLNNPKFQSLWEDAVGIAHENAVKILSDGGAIVDTGDGTVKVDFLPIINQVLQEVQSIAPGFVTDKIDLPAEGQELTRAELRTKIEDALDVKVPPDFGEFTVFRSDELSQAQEAVKLTDKFVVALVVLTLLTGIGALLLSVDRRRTGLQLALGTSIGIFITFRVVNLVGNDLIKIIPEGDNRSAASAASHLVLDDLKFKARVILVIGLAAAAILYLIGPGRWAQWLRSRSVSGTRKVGEGVQTYRRPALDWIHAHVDELRVGGVAVAFILLVVLSATWTTFVVLLVLLAASELGLTVYGRTPSPPPDPEP